MVDWNPAVRAVSHLLGATIAPCYVSFFTSTVLQAYEEYKNRKEEKKQEKQDKNKVEQKEKVEQKALEQKENVEKDKSQEKPKYQINPKARKALINAGMVAGAAAYMAFCYSWESWQFAQSGIVQPFQWASDMGGPILGMTLIGSIDAKPIYEKMDEIYAKGKSKVREFFKGKDEKVNQQERTQEIGQRDNVQQDVVREETKEVTPEVPVWDLSLYEPVENASRQPNDISPGVERATNTQQHQANDSKPQHEEDDGMSL